MNTKPFPALTALFAGGIVCIISFVQRVDMVVFARRFIVTAIVFTIIGLVIKVVIDKNFNIEDDDIFDEEQDEEQGDEESEE